MRDNAGETHTPSRFVLAGLHTYRVTSVNLNYQISLNVQEKSSRSLIFKRRLHELMKQHGVNGATLSAATGITSASISNYRQGRLPRTEALASLAGYFEVPMESLISDSPDKGYYVAEPSPKPPILEVPEEELALRQLKSKAPQIHKHLCGLITALNSAGKEKTGRQARHRPK
jgi:transcriptional regulator with XRE-family HTH domain